ncbi:hypothetical protein HHI36_018323 [Cryptolaemus montrouzieri]|uniref:Uncharacterized protein n=1 Tax=Cryptolaemus montrouzieri TaxID=559131 RepID=A0ABD2NZM1_9CUCU
MNDFSQSSEEIGEEDNGDEKGEIQAPRVTKMKKNLKQVLLTFQDVEESLEKFIGNDSIGISTVQKQTLIIGTDFWDTVELNIKAGTIKTSKIENNSPVSPENYEILQVNIAEDFNEVDFSSILNVKHREEMEKFVVDHRPEKNNRCRH